MSPEEHQAAVVNLGEYEKSTDFFLGFVAVMEDGIQDRTFNPLDNDYIEVITSYWDGEHNE